MGIRRGLVLLLCFGVPRVALADEPSVDPGALRQDLATVVPQELENRHLLGAVVVVVDRQGVVFAEGYGVADLDSRRPVVPETTTFRVASVSKLLTAARRHLESAMAAPPMVMLEVRREEVAQVEVIGDPARLRELDIAVL